MKINSKQLKEMVLEILIIGVIFITILLFFDYTHWNGILEEEDKSIVKKIFNRYYFVTTSISTIGYGDISPKSYSCKFIVSLLQILVAMHIMSIVGHF